MNVSQRILTTLSQGAKLSAYAATQTLDLNAANLLVHGVLARTLRDDPLGLREQDLNLDLALSLEQWRASGVGAMGEAST